MNLANQYCHFFEDEEFKETDRAGFRRRVITGKNLQLCFWRIAGGSEGSFLHKHDEHEQLGIIVRGALGAIVLVDSRRIVESFAAIDYFERRAIPFVIAANRFDGETPHDLETIREALQIDGAIPVVDCDARDWESVKATLLVLFDRIVSLIDIEASHDHSVEAAHKDSRNEMSA